MGPVAVASWCTLRRRGRSILLVALFVGLVGGFCVATAAGARRTGSALDRFHVASRSADIELDGEATPDQVDQLARIPGVVAVGTLTAWGVQLPTAPDFQEIGSQLDASFGVTVDVGRIVAGRAADPTEANEVTIGEGLANRLHLGVGDTIDAVSFSPAQVASILGGEGDVGEFGGPRLRLVVTGIVRRPLDLGDRSASGGLMVLTPAFARAYQDQIGAFGRRVRLRTDGGAAGVASVIDASRKILGDGLFSAQDLSVDKQGPRAAIDLLALALWVCAAAGAIAGGSAIALLLARELQLASVGQARLGELGFTRRQRAAVVASWCAPIGVGGAVLTAVIAAAASFIFPVGVAGRAEPHPGLNVDVTTIALGSLLVLVLVSTVAVVVAYRSTAWTTSLRRVRGRAGVEPTVALSLPMAIGVRSALDSTRGTSAARARSGLVGAVAGALGVIAVLMLAATVDRLVDSPERFGATLQLQVADITANTPCGSGDYGLTDDAAFQAVAEVCSQNVQVDGRVVGAMAISTLRGPSIGPAVIEGRAPRTPGEVALGAKTLRALDKKVGDTVVVAGRANQLEATIVGVVVFPTVGPDQPLAEGAAFTGAGYAPLFDQNLFTRTFVFRLAPGADETALRARIKATPELGDLRPPTVPVEVDRLREIHWLPGTLAALLGVLGGVAVGHALVTSVRRRRRELALLKALGFSARQVRASVAWQASTVGMIGLVVGLPAGVLVGFVVWRRIAGDIGISTASAVPIGVLVLAVPFVLAAVNLVALLPGRTAARTRPAAVFRSE